jgi:hypothetical protein
MGDLVSFAPMAERRRARDARALHAACRSIVAASVEATRAALVAAPPTERAMWGRRLRKLEDLDAYAAALG